MEETTKLELLQAEIDSIRRSRAGLAHAQEQRDAATDRYERSIDILRRRIEKLEQLRDEDPVVKALNVAVNDHQFNIAWQEETVKDLALAAWHAGEFEAKKTTKLDGATVQIRDTTRRTIVDPISFIDQARHAGLYDKLVKSIKVSVNVSDFNRWVDLVEPSSVAVEYETAAYVRID